MHRSTFEFWDAEDKRRVRKKLERLNGFSKEVHVIRVTEGQLQGNKRRRLGDGLFTATTIEAAPALENKGYTPALENERRGVGMDPTVLPVGSSRVTGSADSAEVDDNPLKSTLLPNDVMDRYLAGTKKLRAKLKKVAMSDHNWWLKTFDMNGNKVVKLWCGECKNDCGGGSKVHTKAHIDNLFNNFRRSHIVSTTHVRNFCVAKNVNFDDHPQYEAKNGRPLTLTPEDHKRLIFEGVEILEGVNDTLPDGHKKFTMLGINLRS